MKKRMIALLLGMMCIPVAACNGKNTLEIQSSGYETVNPGDEYYYVKTKRYNGEHQNEEFDCVWADTVDGFKPDDENGRYVAIDGDLNKIIGLDDSEYSELEHGVIYDFEEYEEFCKKYFVEQKYTEEDKNYIIVYSAYPNGRMEYVPVTIKYDENQGVIDYFYFENVEEDITDGNGIVCVIPTDIAVGTKINMLSCYSEIDIFKLKITGTPNNPIVPNEKCLKPVIYLYPEEDNTKVEVSLETNDAELTCTYPKYNDGWSVIADKDGLIKANGKEYNYLYWEGESENRANIDNGFCVKGSDTAEFLEEKLEELGLNRREANEFIVYWLPLMEQNEYNVISFDTKEYENSFKLHVNPAPDTVIRVFMTWYATDEAVDIKPQNIETPVREGFTVIEWGGAQIGGKVR